MNAEPVWVQSRDTFMTGLVVEYQPNTEFIVGEFDESFKSMAGAPYGLYNIDRVYCVRLFPDEIKLDAGRFENFQHPMLSFDYSVIDPAHETESLFNAAAELDKPWSFRLVRYHSTRRYTFSFQDDVTAVEFKLRIA